MFHHAPAALAPLAILAAGLTLEPTPVNAATTYTFESQHTQGVLRWNHLGFSHPTAQFSRVDGSLEYDKRDPTRSSVSVTIPIANLTSGVPDLDDYLRAEEFFDRAPQGRSRERSGRRQGGRGQGTVAEAAAKRPGTDGSSALDPPRP